MEHIPFSVRRSIELAGLFLLFFILVLGKNIIMPLLLSFFFSIVLMPLFHLFRKIKIPEPIAIFLSVILLIIAVGSIFWILSSQVRSLLHDMPKIEKNIVRHADALSTWVSSTFNISTSQQMNFINKNGNKFFNYAENALGRTASAVPGTLLFIGLLPIYTFLIILYRNLLLRFILSWVRPEEHRNISLLVQRLQAIIRSYLFGLLIQFSYMIVLVGITLTLLGIKHGLLIGILFALLNLIPYLGPLIGNILGVLITLAASDKLFDVVIVLGVIAIVQFLDNNILMPGIVGSQVKINALVSIVGIFIGGFMVGISGMFLAMPMIAMFKIIFDYLPSYKNWAILFGDER